MKEAELLVIKETLGNYIGLEEVKVKIEDIEQAYSKGYIDGIMEAVRLVERLNKIFEEGKKR